MTNLKNHIESILIQSNFNRIDEEISHNYRPPEVDDNIITSHSSIVSAHVSEEEARELGVASAIEEEAKELEESPSDTLNYKENNTALLDRLSFIVLNNKLIDGLSLIMNDKINDILCNNILESSKNVSKNDFTLQFKDPKTLVVSFDNNEICASPVDGGFIGGYEIIYIDYSGQKVDFLILRNIDNSMRDITSQYRVLLNNELVPFS